MKDLGYLAQDISILHRKYYKDTRESFKELGLNPTAACVLLTVHEYPQVNQNQVAKSLVIDKGLTTREVNKLQSLDYLVKVAGSGKAQLLTLTKTGEAVVDQVQTIRRSWWQARFDETGIDAQSPLIPAIEAAVASIIDD
ncbi:MarR family winged helix-turn-helix transcriptional regulator [Levilactobacillus andaensis]|uniref:MarR family winged helix-turn-helix transcriptional regulator n=1 Tax=Levilactobacillus andaensis TaxID=2799570 RepID=UPI001944EE7C|nr:MarR family transcriptional regulator [Levilactobacillus andaensis]